MPTRPLEVLKPVLTSDKDFDRKSEEMDTMA